MIWRRQSAGLAKESANSAGQALNRKAQLTVSQFENNPAGVSEIVEELTP